MPSDKEKIIDVLNQGKCRDYVDQLLTKEEVRMLKGMGVKTLGRFEGRDSAVEVGGDGDKDMEARNEELGLQTPGPDNEVVPVEGGMPSPTDWAVQLEGEFAEERTTQSRRASNSKSPIA